MPPHSTKQQPIDEPKENTNSPSDRSMHDQKTIGNQKEHNTNHHTSQHLLPHQGQNAKRLTAENGQRAGEKGTLVTKRHRTMAVWGEYKDDHSALLFQQAILNTKARPSTVTQYDTLLAQ
jgi:hypothetical protein